MITLWCRALCIGWILSIGIMSIESVQLNETLYSVFRGINLSSIRTDPAETAIAYLMLDKDPTTFHWISHLAAQNISVFIFVDRPETNHIYKNKNGIYIVSMASSLAQSSGYSHFGTFAYITKEVTCWDKATFFFSQIATGYKFVWILETDVFIPSFQSFHHIHDRLRNTTVDLIISQVEKDDENLNNWHWKALQPLFLPKPWYHSMACVLGLSRRMLQEIDSFAQKHGKLQFLEFLPVTLAMQKQLIILNPPEFSTITHRESFSCEDILHRSMNWFHPVKRPAEFLGRCIESGEWPLEMLFSRGHS